MKRLLFAALLGLVAATPLHAQYFSFGKNRVQYDRFDWRFIQSDHFDVYYYEADNYYLAEFTAHSLEAAYLQLKDDFNHEITDRIAVIIYASHAEFSQTNVIPLPESAQGIGGVTDKYKNRITVPFQGNYSDFRRTLHHELVHAVFNDMFYGGNLQSIISNNIQLVFPLWFEEGLAEFTALGWDTNTDMFIRDAVINTYLPPIPYLQGYFAYRGGQSMWYYISEVYGREKIAEILERIRLSRSVEAGMRQALGLDLEQLSERWSEWLKKRYWPEITGRENLKEVAQHITKREMGGSYNTSPAITPAGDRIALITNKRGYFDVVVISALDGSVLKTLIKGEDNVDFEELNILNPNLSWSPDGRRLALSTLSGGTFDIALVEYRTGEIRKLRFPDLNMIGSVAWSPDGGRIAFQGSNGPFVDIFVYDLQANTLANLTNDIFSDSDPSWSADGTTVFFASDRGEHTDLGRHQVEFNQLTSADLNQLDVYAVKPGHAQAERLTATPGWNEFRPIPVNGGYLYFLSDKNGIQNIYRMELDSRTDQPVTDVLNGIMQMSATPDGNKIAVNAINGGYLDIFLFENPAQRLKPSALEPNAWAQARATTPDAVRVPALGYARTVLRLPSEETAAAADTTAATPELAAGEFDYRNYTFGDLEDPETGLPLVEDIFEPQESRLEDGRFIPRRYRLSFTPDFTYAGGSLSTGYGVFALTQLVFSDLLGDHQMAFASNLVFDLRNSDYALSYGYFKNRTNFMVNYFHTARSFQSFSGEIVRYRFYGGGPSFSYPINKFERIDYGASFITISQDYASLGTVQTANERRYFLYPSATYTRDFTMPGFITPMSGSRVALSLTGSPPLGADVLQFASVMGDARYYIPLGASGYYTIALRGSGAVSVGRDAQNFYLGGVENWINYQWMNDVPAERLEDLFFTLPAIPMRGHLYNTVSGDKFALANAEFRFPLIAALLPGPIPLLPLYNITGAAFLDVGTAWQGSAPTETLVGSGFGLRTILLGLPVRWDIGWPREDGRWGQRVHYFSLGIDF